MSRDTDLNTFVADLHIHTVLSPCAATEMIPPFIVEKAVEKGINLIAITDHNASANVGVVQRAAEGTGLHVLPGMELQTREGVHVLCLFDTLAQLKSWQAMVDAKMPPTDNNIEYFGEQFVVDETGEFIRRETQLLTTSVDLPLQEAVEGVARLGGMAIPAHVNRRPFGLITNLGFVPTDLPIDALEVFRHTSPTEAIEKHPQLRDFPLIQNGDAHHLNDLLGANIFKLAAPTISEIRLAFQKIDGRSLAIRPPMN
jgi:hypothetical protein